MSQVARQELLTLPMDELNVDPENPRESVGDVQELADSIRETGLLQPIVARRVHEVDDSGLCERDRFVVVAGHRRLAAVQLLGWDSVPCVVREEMEPDEVLAAMLVENGQRANLDPIEEARAYRKLKEQHGLTDMELGKRVGKTQTVVSARLALLSLTRGEQESVRTGQMLIRDGIRRGRERAGTLRDRPTTLGWWFTEQHALAAKAKRRCTHSRARHIGNVACGECWEKEIRADAARAVRPAAKQAPIQASRPAAPRPTTPVAPRPTMSVPTQRFFDKVEWLAADGKSVEDICRAVQSPPYRIREEYARYQRALPDVLRVQS